MTWRLPRSICSKAGNSASSQACHKTAIVGAWPWLAYGKHKESSTAALELLSEAEHLYMGDFSPNVRPVAALKIRAYIAQGRLDEGLAWVHTRGLSASDTLSYLHEFEHITLARVLLAQYRQDRVDRALQEAIELLDRLLKAAEAAERMGSALEILVLQALAHQMQGDLHCCAYSVAARPDPGRTGGLCPRVPGRRSSHGPTAARSGDERDHARLCRQTFGGIRGRSKRKRGRSPVFPSPQTTLVEPLSQRELEILRLFNTDLSGPDIARELVIALSTLRTHTKAIYGKLNVNSRRMAVRRAVELGLI